MAGPRAVRLVGTVLRCYPARWRRRHGVEAAELAVLLMRDGAAPGQIAWSFLKGAARERLTPRPGRRLSLAVCALLVAAASLGVSLGLVSGSAPARAASTVPPGSHSRCHPRQAGLDRHLHQAGGHGQPC
ncbi:MAG TPA: hypothetical protein VHY58_00735 [Streptosporangiaceae bacterium]|jgi:hypothetical protein|nr:hypothetical protein [Streptosporangiaceae bacterium]